MKNEIYYGCENPEAVSYLEFGSINLVKGEKKIWNYWQDQESYDLYMFARYARDLFAFRKFCKSGVYTPEELNKYILNAAHNKMLDYIFKYAALRTVGENGGVCESGSTLYGWIDEAIACDLVYNNGRAIDNFKTLHYIGSDISDMINEGAAAFHSEYKMNFTAKHTLSLAIDDICENITDRLSLFYGVSVSIRYAVRESEDLVKIALNSDLCAYNRLSMTLENETVSDIYGTGKNQFIISLPNLKKQLAEKELHAKFCTTNMQREKDGKNTLRASVIISPDINLLNLYIYI